MQCDLFSNQKTQQNEHDSLTIDSPMQIKLINFLGLSKYLLDKLVFKRNPSSYTIRKYLNHVKLFTPRQYKPPLGYTIETTILQKDKLSVPVVRLIPKKKDIYYDTIVYSHGNSSDLYDGLKFMERMANKYQAEYVIFDYSGYGQSRCKQVGQQVICKDLELVLAWLNKPLCQIVLWGFSLGSYPVLHTAAKYIVKGVILQCPIGSVSCFFQQNLNVKSNKKFKQDHFANIDLIDKVKSQVFLMHSNNDEIIPISHAQLLYHRYVQANGIENIYFIEVEKLAHNALHKYIVASRPNQLQKQVLDFLDDIKGNETIGQRMINDSLFLLKGKIKQAKIQQQTFEEGQYQLVTDNNGEFRRGSNSKQVNNCFCFSSSVQSKRPFNMTKPNKK